MESHSNNNKKNKIKNDQRFFESAKNNKQILEEISDKKSLESKLFGVELAFVSNEEKQLSLHKPPNNNISEVMEWRHNVRTIKNTIIEQWEEILSQKEICKEITVSTECAEKYIKVTFNDEFWYETKWDETYNGTVLEITTKPLTANEWIKREKFIRENIFDIAKKINLTIDSDKGGHIHIDKNNFENDPLLFLNFFIDCQNHPELFLGVFGLRPNNPPLAINTEDSLSEKFVTLLEEFNYSINTMTKIGP